MPLKKGKSKDTVQANIEKIINEGYPPGQAAAITYEKAGRKRRGKHSNNRMR